MIHFILHFLFFGVTLTHSDNVQNACFDRELNGACKCELLFPDHIILTDLHSEAETRLECTGHDALETAATTIASQKHLLFTGLVVANASLETLERRDLQRFSEVRNLSLSGNRISVVGAGALKDLKYLEHLDLSANDLTALSSSVLESLTHLKNLSLSGNRLSTIEAGTFNNLHYLVHLDLSDNLLTSVDSSWFLGLKNLQVLLLGGNRIVGVNGSLHLSQLRHLDLSSNGLRQVQGTTLFRLKGLRFLSLANNRLNTLNESAFKGNTLLEKINLTGNPWICDRKLLPLNEFLKRSEVYRERAVCAEPPELHNYTLQTGLEIVNLELQIEESLACNNHSCNCTISRDKLIITVDCTGRGLTRLPDAIPHKTKVLDLRGNGIRSLTTDHIDARYWSDVSFLYLNSNRIDSLKGLEGTWLLRNLVALHLSDNRLTEIPIHILEQFRGGNLDELYLSGNPWNCDCNTVRFQTWLQDNYRSVRNFENIRCSRESGAYSNQPIYRLKKSQLCPQQVQLVNYLDVLNALMAIAIVVIVVKLSYDYWLQKRTGKLPRFFSLNLS